VSLGKEEMGKNLNIKVSQLRIEHIKGSNSRINLAVNILKNDFFHKII